MGLHGNGDQVMDEMQEVNDIEVDDWLERELEPVESHYNTSQDKRVSTFQFFIFYFFLPLHVGCKV